MRLTRPDGNVVAGLALAGLGGFIAMRAGSWDLMGPDGPGPGFFPFGYGLLMLGLSVALVVQASIRASRAKHAAPDVAGHLRALLTWAVFAGTAVLMQWIGFVAGFAALTVFIVIYVFERPWRSAALVAIGCAGGFWLVFTQVLGVALPAGPWGF
ncbi:tripartite tricarboxylate transporter TctB family protein [Humitalea sp. 24SJ18S-53]|uniref:tripartite tricarboxylate transporter TctB family protein n=1 Tax=Humitalea sp. 24SJ18S-53 TaxID=3422307 RepID=UPI003D66BB5A